MIDFFLIRSIGTYKYDNRNKRHHIKPNENQFDINF